MVARFKNHLPGAIAMADCSLLFGWVNDFVLVKNSALRFLAPNESSFLCCCAITLYFDFIFTLSTIQYASDCKQNTGKA